MARDDPADLAELSLQDARGAVVWRPSPNRFRLVLRWTFRCLVAGSVVAGAWSLRDRYPHIDLGVTGETKQVQTTRAHIDQPVLSKAKEKAKGRTSVAKGPPGKPVREWRPPLDTQSVVRTVPSE